MTTWNGKDYSDIASVDPAEPEADAVKVSEYPLIDQGIRGMLKGWYDAIHAEHEYDGAPAGEIDLEAIDEDIAHVGAIVFDTAGEITNFTNGIEGQLLILRGAAGLSGTVDMDKGTYFALGDDRTLGEYEILVLQLRGTVWYEWLYAANAIS